VLEQGNDSTQEHVILKLKALHLHPHIFPLILHALLGILILPSLPVSSVHEVMESVSLANEIVWGGCNLLWHPDFLGFL
jgi:hypothetical protein